MSVNFRHLPELFALLIGLAAQWSLLRAFRGSPWARRWFVAGAVWMAAGFVFAAPTFARLLPYSPAWEWLRGMGIVYGLLVAPYAAIRYGMVRAKVMPERFQPTRREALVALAPAAFGGYGVFIEPNRMNLVETRIAVGGLAPALDGLRIAQLTDIHFGPYFDRRSLERAIAMANETRPHLAVLTGDFISIRRDPLDECLRVLTALKADAGVYGCLGNHEIAAECQDYAEEEAARLGMRMLRRENRVLRFGGAELNVAGVDYQNARAKHLDGAGSLLIPGVTNLLLSHNPDVFPAAVRQGWDVTLSGHTHGGQVDVEILSEHLNPARFFTPYIYGLYRQGGKSILVSRGLGTVGAPIRAGATPEVNLIRLETAAS
jgi:predicted MPP superfamily phosphohydrolase